MPRSARFLLSLVFAIAGQAAAAQSARPVDVTVSVDTAATAPRIEPAVYGQFAEHLGRGIYEGIWVGPTSRIPNTGGYRNDVLAALKRIKVPVIRWPGGCFADEYDWRDGIGPRDRRPVRINTHWGGVTEDNAVGTHEFMNYSELVGADAYVAGNMGSLAPIDMARWVEYMTATRGSLADERKRNGREQPWTVKYFGVGNESWGCGGNMRPVYSADLHRRYQTFVKVPAGTAPIVKVASGANMDDFTFTDVMMREAAGQMDAISVHYYTIPGTWEKKGPALGFSEADWAATLAKALRMETIVAGHSAVMDKYDPKKRVALYVDEWGTWYDQESGSTPGFLYQQNSLRDAAVAAVTLNIFHRHTDRVKLAAIAQMVNVLQAMILTDKERMVLTPTYHVFDMYVPFQGATPLKAVVRTPAYGAGGKTVPMVDVSAARSGDGRLYLALVNLDPNRPAHLSTDIAAKGARGRVLTGSAMDAHNSFDAPDRVRPAPFAGRVERGKLSFVLPAKSVAVVAVD